MKEIKLGHWMQRKRQCLVDFKESVFKNLKIWVKNTNNNKQDIM